MREDVGRMRNFHCHVPLNRAIVFLDVLRGKRSICSMLYCERYVDKLNSVCRCVQVAFQLMDDKEKV